MKALLARLIAYLFVGSLCAVGPLCLSIALGSAAQRATLIYGGARAEGTVIAKRRMGTTQPTYAPVFQFTASDGRSYIVSSDVYGQESAFAYGQHVTVLYRRDHPEAARIDAFGSLWTYPLVVGVVGAGLSIVPALILANRIRQRRTSDEPTGMGPSRPPTDSPALRWLLGLLLSGSGLTLLAAGFGLIQLGSTSASQSRVLIASLGVLLLACGVLIGQWVATNSRLYRALGAAAMTSMAVAFVWVALYGDAAGFSGGAGFGGLAVPIGSATPARIAFGLGGTIFGLFSLPAWRQVVR